MNQKPPLYNALRSFPLIRAVVVGVLVLFLQIPIFLIWGLIGERQARHAEAVSEVGEKWGGSQTLGGLVWVVPYRKSWVEKASDGTERSRSAVLAAFFLPERLDSSADFRCDYRYRGIFRVPIFEMQVEMEGEFSKPDFAELGAEASQILWERAFLALWISDTHSIREGSSLRWGAVERVFQPGAGEWGASTGIRAHLPIPSDSATFPFSLRLRLGGTDGGFFTPVGRRTRVRMTGNWPDPSFQGRWLPDKRSVSGAGFEAEWEIPAIGRDYPQSWTTDTKNLEGDVRASAFGVRFLSPVDPYRMSERSLKYEFLFLLLTFMVVGLIEALSGCRLHWVQYSLIGAGLCLLYLLLLSLSEHLGFLPAYLLASSGVVGLVAFYGYWVMNSATRGAIVTAVVAGLYLYLYILLRNQDYALLVGSLGLFVALALVMVLTRRIDWSQM